MTRTEVDKPHAMVIAADRYDIPGPRAGKAQVACPVHDEDNPSCSIDYERGLWTCFACGQGGDAMTLVMARESVAFPEAVRLLVEWGAEATMEKPRRARRKGGPRFKPTFGR